MTSKQEDEKLRVFKEAVHDILNSADECNSILPFIELKLRQCGLRDNCTPREVFLEIYNELVQGIKRGREITDVRSSFKLETLRIIRQLRQRKQD
jgi:hypothetical protein